MNEKEEDTGPDLDKWRARREAHMEAHPLGQGETIAVPDTKAWASPGRRVSGPDMQVTRWLNESGEVYMFTFSLSGERFDMNTKHLAGLLAHLLAA